VHRWRFWLLVSVAAMAAAVLAEIGAARWPDPR
jgi:hypothetical protein